MKKFVVFILLLVLIFMTTGCLATKNIDGVVADEREFDAYSEFKGYVFGSNDFSKNMFFRLRLPDNYDEDTAYPLIVYLHGQGAQGTDNQDQMGESFLDAYLTVKDDYPAIVFIPQCPKGLRYDELRDRKNASEELRACIQKGVLERYHIDTDRIYITGISMGGLGTVRQLEQYPDFYAAGFSVCGGTHFGTDNAMIAEIIKDIPLYLTHSADDTIVPVEQSRQIVRALEEIEGKVTYHEFDGLNHNIFMQSYALDGIWEWMFSQRKNS